MFSNPKASNQKPTDPLENLKKYARDLTKAAAEGKLDPVVGRAMETSRMMEIIVRKRKNNPILTGPPGTGKTAIVEALAQRIFSRDVPSSLQDCSLFELDLTSLIAGASYRGEYEERLNKVINEVTASNGKVILFVDEAHQLISASGDSMDAANIMKPALARGELRMIAATTENEYKLHFEKDPALVRRFAKIDIREPSVDETISILRGIKDKYEEFHGVKIKDSALIAAAQLSDRYLTSKFNPDKAIDLVDICCAGVRVQLDSKPAIIDDLERKLLQLNVEKIALEQELQRAGAKSGFSPNDSMIDQNQSTSFGLQQKEDDVKQDDDDLFSIEQTQQRLKRISEQIIQAEAELNPLKQLHEQARGAVDQLQAAKKKLSVMQTKLQNAQRDRDTYLIADLQNFAIPELQSKIKDLEKRVQEEKKGAKDIAKTQLISEIVDAQQIAAIVSQLTGVPLKRLNQSEKKRLLTLDQELSAKVIGQPEAVKAVSDAILRSRAGFSKKGQPIASFLLCGSTGVGKTELAKALATLLFDSERSMVRFDCSEFQEQHSVAKLIGAPSGYVGYEQGGLLTEAVRNNPYSLILFDEVEKAAPNIWNVLLQVLDDGRLTDNKGRVVDFSNTLIIFTSNLGSQRLIDSIDVKTGTFKQGLAATKEKVLTEVKKYFKPEFLNRISELIVFTPLTYQDMLQIITLQINDLNKRMHDKHIIMSITHDAVQQVVMRAYDPLFGARPIKRLIERVVVTTLSRAMIGGELKPYSKVTIGVNSKLLAELKSSGKDQKMGGVGFTDDEDLIPKLLTFTYSPLSPEEIKQSQELLAKGKSTLATLATAAAKAQQDDEEGEGEDESDDGAMVDF